MLRITMPINGQYPNSWSKKYGVSCARSFEVLIKNDTRIIPVGKITEKAVCSECTFDNMSILSTW